MAKKNIADKVAVLKGILGWMTQTEADARYPQISEGDATPIYTAAEVDAIRLDIDINGVQRDMKAIGIPVSLIPMGAQSLGTSAGTAMASGAMTGLLCVVKKTMSLTGFKFVLKTAGDYTADAYNGIAINSIAGGLATKIAETANDGTIWKSTAGVISTKDLPTPVVLEPGLYTITFLYHSSAQVTAPSLQQLGVAGAVTALSAQGNVKQATTITAQTAIPASYTISSSTTGTVLAAVWGY